MRLVRTAILFVTAFVVLAVGGLVSIAVFSPSVYSAGNNNCANTANMMAPQANTGGSVKVTSLDPEQLKIEGMIVGIGIARGRSLKDIKVAIMVAMQESGIRNLSYGDRDSLGIYQQRPSSGWGTPTQILDPVYAINKFYAALEKIANRDSRSLLDVALAVQNPSRAAYTSPTHSFMSWEGLADQLLAGVVSTGTASAAMVYSDTCNNNQSSNPSANNNSAGSWRKPLDSLVVSSPWGMRLHPILLVWKLHDGVDFVAPTGTPIYSIGSGMITVIAYNGAIGNHVTVDYGGGNVVTYEHMSRFGGFSVGATVSPGDVLGYVGATGFATGPHLHLGWVKSGQNINPVPELCQRGIVVPGPQGCAAFAN